VTVHNAGGTAAATTTPFATTSASAPMTHAIVHAADGVRAVLTASHPDDIFERLATYVRRRCDDVLRDEAAAHVRTLLDDGKLPEGVTHYFERIGERWDDEHLSLVTLEAGEYWIPDAESMVDVGR